MTTAGKFEGSSKFLERLNSKTGFRILVGVFGLVLLILAIVPLRHCLRGHSIKDYIVWYQAGQLVLHGQAVYPDSLVQKFDFMYPPPCALFLAPVSWLGQFGLIFVLVVINGAAWIASIVFSVHLATWERGRRHALLYLVPNFIVIVAVWSNFLLGQPSLLLLAFLLGAFICLRRKHQIFAGALIGLAAAIKAFPVIAILYLVYRRYWVAAGSLVMVLAFLLALPTPFRGVALAKQDLERWTSGMLLKYDEGGVGQRAGRSNGWKNQSIFGLANRMLRHVEYDFRFAAHTPEYANIADLKFLTVNIIILGSALFLGLVYTGVMPRRDRRTAETDAIEFALLLLLMLIFTPLSFGYLYAWLLYPFTVIVHRMMIGASAALFRWTIAALVLLALTIPDPRMAQTYGSIFFTTLSLFIGLASELWQLKRGKIRGPETPIPAGRLPAGVSAPDYRTCRLSPPTKSREEFFLHLARAMFSADQWSLLPPATGRKKETLRRNPFLSALGFDREKQLGFPGRADLRAPAQSLRKRS